MPEASLFLVFNTIPHRFWWHHAARTQVPLSPWWVEPFLKFESCFCWKTYHFVADFGANTIEQLSEMLFYIILSTLEKFEHWNWRVLTKIICVRYHQDNYLLINVACRQNVCVWQCSTISGCIDDNLKFGAFTLVESVQSGRCHCFWMKQNSEPYAHLVHACKQMMMLSKFKVMLFTLILVLQ